MRSATSFFNKALFKSLLQRCWPLWFAYALVWLLILPIPLLSYGYATRLSYSALTVSTYGGVVMGAVFGIFFAMAMFSYLTSPRATGGLHALPLRRDSLFLTGALTGLFMQLTTLLAVYACTGLIMAARQGFNATALGDAFLFAAFSMLLFYPLGILCMICAGQSLAAPVFYAIANGLFLGMEVLLRGFAGNFLYGYTPSAGFFTEFLTPIYFLMEHIDVRRSNSVPLQYSGLGYFALYAACGLVLGFLALLLYRSRKSEMTGNTVAITWLRPVFKYGVAVCTAFSLGQLIYDLVIGFQNSRPSLPATLACMLFAGLLGYFAAEMLLKKSVNVFRSSWKGAAAVATFLLLLGISFPLDLTGYQTRVPDASDVESAYVYYHSGDAGFGGNFYSPETIARLTAAQQAVLDDRAFQKPFETAVYRPTNETESVCSFEVRYTLKNGTTLSRSYELQVFANRLGAGTVEDALTAFINCPEVRFYTLSGDASKHLDELRFTGCYCYDLASGAAQQELELTAAQAAALYAALTRDCEVGHGFDASLFVRQKRTVCASVELFYNYPDPESGYLLNGRLAIDLNAEMTNTLDTLRSFDLLPLPD